MGVVDGQRRKGGEKERKREGVEESWEARRGREVAERQGEWVERKAGVAEAVGGAESGWVGRWAGSWKERLEQRRVEAVCGQAA